MNLYANFKLVDRAALSRLLLRVLCILIIEHSCAQLVQQSSGTPAVAGNYVLASIFGLALIVALFNRKIGFAIGIDPVLLVIIMVIVSGFFVHNPLNWALVIVMIVVHHRKILAEEHLMQEDFARAWTVYSGRVRRYIGWSVAVNADEIQGVSI